MEKIYYAEGYEYQLRKDYSIQTNIIPNEFVYMQFIRLDTNGMLHILAGYAWDGASGPAIDTKNFMRGSLVHDALCQLIDERYLDHKTCWKQATECLDKILKEDGMSTVRRWWVRTGVNLHGTTENEKRENPTLEAP